MRGTGTSARNTGSGDEVGVHQDGTWVANFYSTTTSDTRLFLDKSIASNESSYGGGVNAETVSISSGRRLGIPNSSNGNAVENYSVKSPSYTTRPTNTSVLYCIKYEPTWSDGTGSGDGGIDPPLTDDEMNGILEYILAPSSVSDTESNAEEV